MAEHADAVARQLDGSSRAAQKHEKHEAHAVDDHETDEQVDAEEDPHDSVDTHVRKRISRLQLAMTVGVAAVVALGCLVGWLGYHTYEARQTQAQRNQLVEVARQGAVNLTTIDYTEADADIRRILDSSTGTFHDDFQKRSQPFVDVVKQAKSKSVGTVTAAGLQSQDGDQAQVLVAVSVKTSNAGAPEQDPRAWRMRINVQKVGDDAKVSAVQFVP